MDNDCLEEQCFKSKSEELIFQCGSEDQNGIREHLRNAALRWGLEDGLRVSHCTPATPQSVRWVPEAGCPWLG